MRHLVHSERFLKHCFSTFFIYPVFIGFVVLDILVEIYHRICFPLYGIKIVDRKKYIKVVDRNKLQYLNFLDRFNCMYCGYGVGLINYVKEITSQTEIYWCGIKHQNDGIYIEPEHHKDFLPYGDKEVFNNFLLEEKSKNISSDSTKNCNLIN